ncbi:hypothetical protein [Aquabacterium sp.]|uniref:hypothetical protein n=1 Tax=Aquabacterium sp. TaxID=1872578 RepID=UPI002488768C|nr:hypothetical protein [Aquabacterium sp.]MDI1261526.1 hypothetical protein [Aquabacterium sp.]
MLLEVNALVIGLMITAFFVHEATALWDVTYAVSKRLVSPGEQHVHSFLELLPLMCIVMVSLLKESQFLALFGLGIESARFDIALKSESLSAIYIAALLAAATVFPLIPYLNELWRGVRARNEPSNA